MFDNGRPIVDWVELGVVVIVLCDKLEPDMRLLVAEVDRDCFQKVEMGVGVRDNKRSVCEDDVLYFDCPCFAFVDADEKILAAAESVEQGAAE